MLWKLQSQDCVTKYSCADTALYKEHTRLLSLLSHFRAHVLASWLWSLLTLDIHTRLSSYNLCPWSNPCSWGQMVTADSGPLTLLLHITKDCHHITKDCHPSTHQHMPRVQEWNSLHTQSWDITILLCNVKIGSVMQPWDCANSPICVENSKRVICKCRNDNAIP